MSEPFGKGHGAGVGRMEHAWENILKRNEQRASARHTAFEQVSWLAWHEDGEFQCADGLLQDISRGGAALEVSTEPAEGTVWVCLEVSGRVWGAEFEVIAVTPGRTLEYRVRGRFPAGCPEEMYRVALRGFRAGDARTPHARGGGQGLWRGLKDRVLGQGERPGTEDEGVAIDSVALRPLTVRLLAEGATEVVLSNLAARPPHGRSGSGRGPSRFVIPEVTAPFQHPGH